MAKKKKTDIHTEIRYLLKDVIDLIKEPQYGLLGFWDNADLKQYLHVSDVTLYRWRKAHLIPYKKIGKKYYYPKRFFLGPGKE